MSAENLVFKVFNALGNTWINMEMKTADEEMVEEVHRIITKYYIHNLMKLIFLL